LLPNSVLATNACLVVDHRLKLSELAFNRTGKSKKARTARSVS
jgi:hypothetical protein